MDVEIYDQWQRTTALLKMLAHAEADVDAGRTVSQVRFFRYVIGLTFARWFMDHLAGSRAE